jgi:hypothetical protein
MSNEDGLNLDQFGNFALPKQKKFEIFLSPRSPSGLKTHGMVDAPPQFT